MERIMTQRAGLLSASIVVVLGLNGCLLTSSSDDFPAPCLGANCGGVPGVVPGQLVRPTHDVVAGGVPFGSPFIAPESYIPRESYEDRQDEATDVMQPIEEEAGIEDAGDEQVEVIPPPPFEILPTPPNDDEATPPPADLLDLPRTDDDLSESRFNTDRF